MPTYTYPGGPEPRLYIRNCTDDVTISGGAADAIEVITGADEDEIAEYFTPTDDGLIIDGFEETLNIRVPSQIAIELSDHEGDATLSNVSAARLRQVSGDVRLRDCKSVQLEYIGGDLVVDHVESLGGRGAISGDARITAVGSLQLGGIDGDLDLTSAQQVTIAAVEGDADLTSVGGACQIDRVSGDLDLREVEALRVGRVSGDLDALRVRALSVDSVDGDVSLNVDQGEMRIGVARSDLSARLGSATIQVQQIHSDAQIEGGSGAVSIDDVRGDLTLRLSATTGAYRARVRGDATVTMPQDASITISARARGGVHGPLASGNGRRRATDLALVIGSGGGQLSLDVGGDLTLHGPSLTHPGGRGTVSTVSSTGPTVRLRAEDADRAAAGSDAERLAILRMLSEGRLDLEEADRLLAALDSVRSAPRVAVAAPVPPTPPRVPTPPRAVRTEGDVFAGLTADDLIRLRANGIDRQYIGQLRQFGLSDLSIDDLIELRAHGVTPEYIARMREFGLRDLDPSDLTQLSRSGVTPEYVAQLQAGGLPELSTDDVIQLSSSGVKPEFVAAVTAAGIADADIDAIVELARSGVSPEYLGDMQRQGITDLTGEDVIDLVRNGVTPEYIARMRASGIVDLSVESLIELSRHGVTPDFAAALRSSDAPVDAETLIERHEHGDES